MTQAKRHKLLFGLILLFFVIPVLGFPLISYYIHDITGMPQIENAAIDLTDYDFSSNNELPLDGYWEFYPHQWIVSDPQRNIPPKPSSLEIAPSSWKTYPGFNLPSHGYSSFRITLKNMPANKNLMCHIANIYSSYRIFIDGKLMTERGEMRRFYSNETYNPALHSCHTRETFYNNDLPSGDLEMVIELSSPHVGGLYRTPFLTTSERYQPFIKSQMHYASILTGIILVSVGSLLMILFTHGQNRSVIFLIAIDVIVWVRVLLQNDFFWSAKQYILFDDYYLNSIMQAMILFLPIIFLFCTNSLVNVHTKQKYLFKIALYELAFTPVIIVCAWQGRPQLQFTLCLVTYIPFLFVIYQLYRSVCDEIEHSLMVHAIFIFVLTSMLVSAMNSAGFLNVTIPLFPATYVAISTILQLWLYLWRNIDVQRNEVEMENLRLRLRQSETNLMLSQIKPHFLYNTLIAIQVLCTTQPDLAAKTVLKFSKFLRANMDFISSHDPIPFVRELEHIRNYTDIEKLRFQRRLEVVFEIEATEFLVPPLTIQPLVENAIRHGACKKVQGGKVILRTLERDDGYLIEVIDDGAGFDLDAVVSDGTPHGLQNVMFRLKEVMSAKVKVHTAPGEGTTVCVLLPKETAHLENDSHSTLWASQMLN